MLAPCDAHLHAPWHAVIFDLDGTLIDTETIYRDAFMAAARELAVALPPGLYDTLVGLSTPERRGLMRVACGPQFPAENFFTAYYARRAALMPTRIPVRAGAVRLLQRLRRPKAVATSASRRTAADHLARAGLSGHFAHLVTRDDVDRGKPAPDAFLCAAERLGVVARNCIAVEDSEHGVASAHAAGMRVIMVAREVPNAVRQKCAAVAATLAEVGDLLMPAA